MPLTNTIESRVLLLLATFYLSISAIAAPTLESPALNQSNTITIETKTSAVTVYQDRAQVTRSFSKEFKRGKYTLVFDQLPQNIDPDSIQIKGRGRLVLNDVSFRKNSSY